MQIKHRAFQKGGAGSIKLVPEDDEDIWHIYNLIMHGDEVRASTSRKVQVRASLLRLICPTHVALREHAISPHLLRNVLVPTLTSLLLCLTPTLQSGAQGQQQPA